MCLLRACVAVVGPVAWSEREHDRAGVELDPVSVLGDDAQTEHLNVEVTHRGEIVREQDRVREPHGPSGDQSSSRFPSGS